MWGLSEDRGGREREREREESGDAEKVSMIGVTKKVTYKMREKKKKTER